MREERPHLVQWDRRSITKTWIWESQQTESEPQKISVAHDPAVRDSGVKEKAREVTEARPQAIP